MSGTNNMIIHALRFVVFCAGAWLGLSENGHADSMTLISSASLSGTGVVTFSSIPATYNHLRVIVVGRGTQSATSTALLLTLNNDTGSNYVYHREGSIDGSTISSVSSVAQTSITVGNLVAASSTANYASALNFLIPMYAGTTFKKTAHSMEYTPQVKRVV